MRPRGQTPRMLPRIRCVISARKYGFNEAAGADPADARTPASLRPGRRNQPRFNEAAGADPADAPAGVAALRVSRTRSFNEAAGADPADAPRLRERRPSPPCFNEAAGADPADARAVRGSR